MDGLQETEETGEAEEDGAADEPHDLDDGVVMNEVKLILAEKRTSLAGMRTGIAVFALPLSVLSVLVATSRYYDVLQVWPLLVPLLVLSLGMVVLGTYLIVRAMIHMRHYDRMIRTLKQHYGWIAPLLD